MFEWAGCVAYALLAALIIRLIVFPVGPLLDVPLLVRVGAAAFALAGYYVTGGNLLLGVAAGAAGVGVFGAL
jgi:hypothetical protein